MNCENCAERIADDEHRTMMPVRTDDQSVRPAWYHTECALRVAAFAFIRDPPAGLYIGKREAAQLLFKAVLAGLL